jgi:Sec-independent protein secretion pathway component TatC
VIRRADLMKDIGTRISTLWIVVMITMIYADILSFITPGELQKLWDGSAGVHLTPGLLLAFAILLEIPVAMIFLSRVLKPRANRWANTVAVAITIVYVVGGGSFNLPHYVFFAAVEIACMAMIVWSVWARRSTEAAARLAVGEPART